MTSERNDDGLLPCPFCGGFAEVVHIDEGENAGGSCVCCTSCLASGDVEFEFKENFVNNWNRRSVDARIAALTDALEFYANPDIYKMHPHGLAFDRRDLSFRARAALSKSEGQS